MPGQQNVIRVGLVDTTGALDASLVQAAAAAINIQVTRDLPQFWPIQATVEFLASPRAIPSGVWPVKLVASLPPGEGGFHLDLHNQPYAKVIGTPDDNSWTIDASHEILEMLVDPNGNRMQVSGAIGIVDGKIVDQPGEFSYLVEACDPCEANGCGYGINGITVSDFITPHFYDATQMAGLRYSFNNQLTAPRQILPGGYISFLNQETETWQQILYVDPNAPPTLHDLGPATNRRSHREWVDNMWTKEKASLGKARHQAVRHAPAHVEAHRRDHSRRLAAIAEIRARYSP